MAKKHMGFCDIRKFRASSKSAIQNFDNDEWVLGGNANSIDVDDWYVVSVDSISKKISTSNYCSILFYFNVRSSMFR